MTDYLIYMAESPSGGRYIGLTGRPMKRRLDEHRRSSQRTDKGSHCRALRNALIKYHFDTFRWTVLIDGLTKEEADHLERFLISVLQPEYNIAAGGFSPVNGQRHRAVICINTGKQYASGREAARSTGAHPMSISTICRRGGRTREGLRFRFADADEILRPARSEEAIAKGKAGRIEKLMERRHSPETISLMSAAAKARGMNASFHLSAAEKNRKAVVCVETGTVFRDAGEAAMAHGVKRSHVYDRLFQGRRSTLAGVTFRHASADEVERGNARALGGA